MCVKIVRSAIGRRVSYGILEGDSVQALKGAPFDGIKPLNEYHHLSEVKLLAPCTPSKVVALGLNYRDHAREFNLPVPQSPLIFLKPSTAVIGPEADIIYPLQSHRVDYEGELAVVIKKRAAHVPLNESFDYVLGYTCCNDVTARDLQSSDKQWTRAKGFDTFAPIGPWIETELDPSGLSLETYLNGELKQKSNTVNLIFSVPELVSFISSVMTLLPGDIITTGTSSGVGPMLPGDKVEVKIERVGTLRNYVVSPP